MTSAWRPFLFPFAVHLTAMGWASRMAAPSAFTAM